MDTNELKRYGATVNRIERTTVKNEHTEVLRIAGEADSLSQRSFLMLVDLLIGQGLEGKITIDDVERLLEQRKVQS